MSKKTYENFLPRYQEEPVWHLFFTAPQGVLNEPKVDAGVIKFHNTT